MVASPKLGARFRVSDALSLRASSSRGFRSSVGVVGDPSRAPILAWAHEVGADFDRGALEGSLALFRMDVSNERVLDPVTREVSSAGSSVRQGIDLDAEVRLRPWLRGVAAATWNDARLTGRYADTHGDHHAPSASAKLARADASLIAAPSRPFFHAGHPEDEHGERVPGVACYTGRLGLEADGEGGATAHATWRFTGPYVPIGEPEVRSRSFSVLDVGASIPVGRNLVVDAELQNALGVRYAELRASGYVTPGTSRALRVAVRFKARPGNKERMRGRHPRIRSARPAPGWKGGGLGTHFARHPDRSPPCRFRLRDAEAKVLTSPPFHAAVQALDDPDMQCEVEILALVPEANAAQLMDAMSADRQADLFRTMLEEQRGRLIRVL